jgi:hypothetical protein
MRERHGRGDPAFSTDGVVRSGDQYAPNVPTRFTRHLFIDARHKPCQNRVAKAGKPARLGIVDIHPVYPIDVCKFASKTKCDVNDDSVWTHMDQWEPAENG